MCAILTLLRERHASSEHWAGVKRPLEIRREARAERKWTKEQIRAAELETPAFAILERLDQNGGEPPPYVNVRSLMPYQS